MRNDTPRLGRWVLALGAAAALVVVPSPSSADTTADDFGLHVRHCALHMDGFNRDMNPGMHQGITGWSEAEHPC